MATAMSIKRLTAIRKKVTEISGYKQYEQQEDENS